MKLVDFIPTPAKAWLALGIVVAVTAAAAYIHVRAYNNGWDAHVVVAEAEKLKMRLANEEAIQAAKNKLLIELGSVRVEKERLENEIQKLNAEGDADPAAHTGGLSADSVRRVQAVR